MTVFPGQSRLRLVLATANPDKAAELRQIVAEVAGDRIELLDRPDGVPEVEETGETLEENARLKARALAEATGLAALADDTGLEVDALGGRPGVFSSRFAGESATYEDNVAMLLSELEGAGAGVEASRGARFRTVAVALFPDGRELVAVGIVEGRISPEPRGEGGFGYDPVFLPDGGEGRSFAQMSPAEKHALSHRGRAVRGLAKELISSS